jgi:Carboxypeptidase regulatory-like domain
MIANGWRETGLRRAAVGLAAALAGLLPGPQAAFGQAALRGRVVDSETGVAIAKAAVRIAGDSTHYTTDSTGRFEARDLRGGTVEVTLEAPGYAKKDLRVAVPLTGGVELTFALDFTGFKLPEIVVAGRVEQLAPRYTNFEQRRQRGMGAFLRWDDLLKKGSNSVGDALRTVRGVKIQCDQRTFECSAAMARSPTCHPTWWVDGVQVHSFDENTPVRDVYGIEIYRGPGEVPGEFGGSDAACGVIALWTKSRPYRD